MVEDVESTLLVFSSRGHHRPLRLSRGWDDALVFDGDDTLWETMPLFREAKQSFLAVVRSSGLPTENAIDRLDEIDRQRVESEGLTPARFGGSLLETYRTLCAESSVDANPATENRLRAIGTDVAGKTAMTDPAARAVLTRLRCAFHLLLLTQGDEEVQAQRISDSGIAHLFDVALVVNIKNESVYRRLRRDLLPIPRRIWMIGNSLNSDVLPSLAAGYKAIWIDRPTWVYEDETNSIPRGVHACQMLTDVPRIVTGSG